MLRQHEMQDVLALLTIVGQGVGAKELSEQYVTPREDWAAKVDAMGWAPGVAAAERQAAVGAFIDAAEA